MPNQITGANAGGPRQLPMPTRWAARVAQFCRCSRLLTNGSKISPNAMRHLTEPQIQSVLRRGRHVEQLLSPATMDGETVLRWIDLRASNDQFVITFYEVCDDGSKDYVDIYSLARVAPDEDPVRRTFIRGPA